MIAAPFAACGKEKNCGYKHCCLGAAGRNTGVRRPAGNCERPGGEKLTKEAAAKAAETTKAADEKQSSQSSSSNEKQGSSSSKKSSGNNFNTYSNDYSDVSKNYVLNTNTKKFHYPSCRSVEKIAPKTLQPVKQGMKQFPKGMTLAEYAIHNP